MNYRLGLFDSGIGGTTVLKSIEERHSEFKAVYLADTARMPYGSRSPLEIRVIAQEIIQWLNVQQIDAIVVACNTTNSLALDVIKKHSIFPIFDLVSSTVELIKESDSRLGVLATSSTVSSKAYTTNIHTFYPNIYVIEEGCPELVPMIEKGDLSSTECIEVITKHLEPLLAADVEAIVLGCSHYPILKPMLTKLLPSHIRLIDPSIGLAKKLDNFLKTPHLSLETSKKRIEIHFCVTSDPLGFSTKMQSLLGIKPEVEVISLRSPSSVS